MNRIPKIIHYCWFGGNEKPEIVKKCIDTWRKFCPDWEIKEWNENNYDVTANLFMKEAFVNKKWAFVSDVVRLDVVLKYGGIYLDTDVELLSSIDTLLDADAIYFFESDRNINTGWGFGAVKNHESVKKMFDYYGNRHFVVNGKMVQTPCPDGNTEALKTLYPAFQRNGKTQFFSNIKVYSSEEYVKYMYHYAMGSWIDGHRVEHKQYHDWWIKRFLRDYQKFDFVEKYLGKTGVQIYTFLVYDLLEMGPFYYIKRIISRIQHGGK